MAKPPKRALPVFEALKAWAEPGAFPESLCRSGEWGCWARRGGPDGPWDELWLSEWNRKVLGHREIPSAGIAGQIFSPEGLRVYASGSIERLEFKPVPEPTRDGKIKFVERLVATEKWYGAVFAPRAPAITPEEKLKHDFREWVASLGGRIPGRDECIAVMQARHPSASERAILRLKKLHAPGGKGGRPSEV